MIIYSRTNILIIFIILICFYGKINGILLLQNAIFGPTSATFILSNSYTTGSYFKLVNSGFTTPLTIVNSSTATINYVAQIINIADSFQLCETSGCSFFNPITWNPFYISNISSIPTKGGTVTVNGVSLSPGSTNTTNIIYLNMLESLAVYASSTNPEGTIMTFEVGENITSQISGTGIPNIFNIRRTTSYGNTAYTYHNAEFAFNPPTITSVTFNRDASQLTVIGNNFGAAPVPLTLTSNGSPLQYTRLVNHTTLLADVNPRNYSYSGDFKYNLAVGSPNSQSTTSSLSLDPYILSVTSTSSLGGPISITGYRLNLFKPNDTIAIVEITVGGLYKCPVLNLNDPTNTFIVCQMPAIPSGAKNYNLSVVVTIDGKTSNNDVLFSSDLPTVQDVTQEGGNVILSGISYGTDPTAIELHFMNSTIMTPIAITDSLLTFKFPANTSSGIYTGNTLTKHNTSPTTQFNITIHPYLTSVTSPPTQGGPITISGQYMSSLDPKNDSIQVVVMTNQQPQPCSNATRLNSTSIVCKAPAGSGTTSQLQMSLNGIQATVLSGLTLRYQTPKVLSATPISPFGGNITISGESLGYNGVDLSKITITIANNRGCKPLEMSSSTTVICALSNGQFNLPPPTNYLNVTISVFGQTSYNSTIFRLDNDEYFEILDRVTSTDYTEIENHKQKVRAIVLPLCLLAPVIVWSILMLLYHQITYKVLG